MKKVILNLFLLLSLAFGSDRVLPKTFSAPTYEITDLSARRFSDGSILVISGYVNNLSYTSTSGYVIIHVGRGNSITMTLEQSVNGGSPFAHGEKGFFEASSNLEPKQPLDTVIVEYVPNKVVLNK